MIRRAAFIAGGLVALHYAERLTAAVEAHIALSAERMKIDREFMGMPEDDYVECPNCEDGRVGEGEMAVECPRCGGLGAIPESDLKEHERFYRNGEEG